MIWLIGNKGMLGTEIDGMLKSSELEYVGTDKELDITDINALKDFVKDKDVEYIINCAAYTNVDKAEEEKDKAFAVNRDGVKNVAHIAKEKDAVLIHFSTDYVFDGEKEFYSEKDDTNPIGVYGESKLAGEKEIEKLLKKFVILRISWLFGKHGNNFVNTMIKLFKEKDEIKVVSDQYGSPTYTKDLAEDIIEIINLKTNKYGIYHYSNEGKTSWYLFARKIKRFAKKYELIDKEIKLKPVPTSEYPTKAKRPKISYFHKDKIKKMFKLDMRRWQIAVKNYIKDLAGY